MGKQDTLEFEGVVTDLLPNAMFRVKLDNGHNVTAVTLCPLSNLTLNIAFGSKSVTTPSNSNVSCFPNYLPFILDLILWAWPSNSSYSARCVAYSPIFSIPFFVRVIWPYNSHKKRYWENRRIRYTSRWVWRIRWSCSKYKIKNER